MKVIFLCGGVGERMFPMAGDKCLFQFLGKTLLEYQIEKSLDLGLDEFVLVGNQGNIGRLREISSRFPEACFAHAVQKQPSGMAEAIQSTRELAGGEIAIVNPGDIFEQSAYTAIFEARQADPAASYILGTRVKEYFPGGYLQVDGQNILRIVEKPKRGEEPSDLVTIVLHLHTDVESLFRYLAEMGNEGPAAYEQSLNHMIKQGHRFRLVEYRGFWQAIKYPWHLLAAMEHFLAQSPETIAPSALISGRATLEGKVIIDENVRVLENAVVRGPCYIGKNTIIGNNVLIRDHAHIGANCVVGFSTEIKHSYIGDGCWFHSNYIGDSVIGDNCSFGAGTRTANLRFDGEMVRVHNDGGVLDTGLDKLGAIIGANSKTGINVSIMPGVRIGPDSIVGPHLVLGHDVGPNKTVQLDSTDRTIEREK